MKNSMSINDGKIWVNPLRTKLPIFTAKQLKAILDHVQNDAKNRPNKTTKTTELMVLLLIRGLVPVELLGLNIEDLPCCHGKNSIIVRKVRKLCYGYGVPREVYLLDDSLENKINEYVKKYRQGAEPNEPLFISRSGKRTSTGVVGCKLYGAKPQPGRNPNRGISQKLGIKPLRAYMFKRTAIYQLAGRINIDTTAEKMRLKSKAMRVTLKKFMSTYCKGNYSEAALNDLTRLIYNANARGNIELPEPRGSWRRGQSKKYSIIALIRSWTEYQDELRELPPLDYPRINIAFKDYKE